MLDGLAVRVQPGELRVLLAELGYRITDAQEVVLAPAAGALPSALGALSEAPRGLLDAIDRGDTTASVRHAAAGALPLLTGAPAKHALPEPSAPARVPNVP